MDLTPQSDVLCLEVGGSGRQFVGFRNGDPRFPELQPSEFVGDLLIAVPGVVRPDGTVTAENLGWVEVDPAEALGLDRPASLVINDAEAAVRGESALRGGIGTLLYVGLGTGVGGAFLSRGVVECGLVGHLPGFGERQCPCGQVGCLETVAGGWAMPTALNSSYLDYLAKVVGEGVRRTTVGLAVDVVVVGGGVTHNYPELVAGLASQLPGYRVEASVAPDGFKSAAAWGLLDAWNASLQ